MTPVLAIVRETTALTDVLCEALVPALQTQISRDFAPHWQQDAQVIFVPGGQMIPGGAWRVLLLDNSDQADDLGYHDTSGPKGEPQSKIFVRDILRDKLNWNVTVSHEALEMLADPWITRTIQVVQDGVTWEYALEVADAPEDDSFAYSIDGHMMTDFVLPSWFETAGVAPFTFRNNPQIRAPFALADGGYIGRRQIAPVAGDWVQLDAEIASARQVKGPQSRTMRRFAPA